MDAVLLQVGKRVVQILRPRAPMPIGNGQDVGHFLRRETSDIDAGPPIHDESNGRHSSLICLDGDPPWNVRFGTIVRSAHRSHAHFSYAAVENDNFQAISARIHSLLPAFL